MGIMMSISTRGAFFLFFFFAFVYSTELASKLHKDVLFYINANLIEMFSSLDFFFLSQWQRNFFNYMWVCREEENNVAFVRRWETNVQIQVQCGASSTCAGARDECWPMHSGNSPGGSEARLENSDSSW